MPDYGRKMLTRFAHWSIKPHDSPITYIPPVYGAKAQDILATDTSATLDAATFQDVQEVIGCGMWYARMTDSPTLTAVSILSSEQADRKASILPKIERYLGHLLQYPGSKVRFLPSDMAYTVYGDVSHNSVSKGRSRAGGLGFFGWRADPTRLNGAVFTMSSILDVVTSSAAEGEYGAAYMVARHAVWMRTIANALGHPQAATTIWCDNTCAVGLCNDTLKTARTKSIDLRFHWLRDRVRQAQFKVQWIKSSDNIADFFTKALPVHEHLRRLHQLVIPAAKSLSKHTLRGMTHRHLQPRDAARPTPRPLMRS